MASEDLRRMDNEVRRRQARMGEHKDALSALKHSSKSKALAHKKTMKKRYEGKSFDEAKKSTYGIHQLGMME